MNYTLKRAAILTFVLIFTFQLKPSIKSSASYVDQSRALLAYEKLWNTFDWDCDGCPIYPDEYGGEYIDGDKLYLWIVGLTDEIQKKYHSICDYSDKVVFLNANYSLNELDALKTQVMNLPIEYHITGCVADRRENKLRVYLQEEQKENIAMLKQLLGDVEFIIEKQNYMTFCSTNLYAGTTLGASSGTFTLGVCGTYNSQPAILTAGHCAPHKYTSIRYGSTSGTVFATVQDFQFEDDEIGDYAIATINTSQQNNYLTTNILQPYFYPQNITGTVLNGWLPVGTNIYAYGSVTGLVSGTISQMNMPFKGNIYTENNWTYYEIDGLFQVTPFSANTVTGDSGGPVFINYSTMGTQFQGTISGSTSSYFYYSPVSYAQVAGFTVKTN